MIINYLILDGFKRFSLGRIRRFEYRPVQKTQLILGSNGSGKSSLLGMLSPLPVKGKEFMDGGYKEISISHDGYEYVLKSSYNGKHSFVRDGEELNSGSTLAIQKQLVEETFGLNDKLFEILCGSVNLCDMGVGERRKWFTELSDNDYAYISDVYGKVKDELSRKTVELKTTVSLLDEANGKLLSEEDAIKLRDSCKAIEEEIEALQGLKMSVDNDEMSLVRGLRSLEVELDMSVGRLRGYMRSIRQDILVDDYRDYMGLCNQIDNYNSADERELQICIEKHDDLKQSVDSIRDLPGRELYVVEIEKLDNEISSIRDDVELDIERLSSAFSSIKETLLGVLTELPENEDLTFSKANFELCLNSISEAQGRRVTALENRDRVMGVINRLESILNDDPTQCPSCGFEWILGYDKSLYERSKSELETFANEIDLLDKTIAELTDKKSRILEYFTQYRILTQAFNVYGGLYNVYSNLQDTIRKSPSLAIQKLRELEESYNRQLTKLNLIQKRDKLKAQYMEILKHANENTDGIEKTINQLEITIRTLTDRIEGRRKLKALYLEQINVYDKINKEVENIKSKINTSDDLNLDYFKVQINVGINELLKQLLSESVYNRNQLSQYTQQHKHIEMLNKSVTELEKSIKALKVLNEILSPKSGLIAESLVGFINQILEYITRFINSVWTYNVEIIPVMIENDDDSLDYRFKVMIDDNSEIDDISEASRGLKEIINLAFKICIMSYKQFQGYPLYLDEFGAAFDVLHRRNASMIIEQLIAEDRFSNIFMVSHYEESYGSLQNVDTVIMHDGNIHIPKEFTDNGVVTIEYGM